MNYNTSTVIVPAQRPYYDRILIDRTIPYLLYDMFADRRPLPMNESDQLKARQYGASSPATVPITEGQTPDGKLASYSEVTFTIDQYGDYYIYTDKVSYVNQDPLLTELGVENGEQARETIDEIRRNAFVAGTQVRRASGAAARTSITDSLSVTDLDVVNRAMWNNKCRHFETAVDAQNGYATSPTRAAWFVITHSDCIYDIENLTGFISVEKYMKATKTYESEIGQVGNFRFLVTSKGKKWADAGGTAVTHSLKYTTASSACDVYASLVISTKGLCVSDLKGKGLKMVTTALGSAGSADPLSQRGTIGWVAWLGQGILDETRVYRIEHGVTALS
jgi:N4-gp56 family major capsid protein